MPVPDHAAIDAAVARLVAAYTAAEAALFKAIARRIAVGIDDPDWEAQQRAQLAQFRSDVTIMRGRIARAIGSITPDVVATVSALADKITAAEVGVEPDPPDRIPQPVQRARARTTNDIEETLAPIPIRMESLAISTYQAIVAQAIDQDIYRTRRAIAQGALDRFAMRGIAGFVDKSGRNWEMATYTEMATRTMLADHAIGIQAQRLLRSGHDLVIVSNSPQECHLCRPFEGKILSISGENVGTVQVLNPATNRPVTVNVMTSVARAYAAGLHHPNCRHSESAYLPGVTTVPTATADPEGDKARQHLRYLERQKRAWLRRVEVALDDAAARKAHKHVDAYTRQIKEHVRTSTAKRQPAREQIVAAR